LAQSHNRLDLLLRLHALRLLVARQATLGADAIDLSVNTAKDLVVGTQAAHLDPVGPEIDRDRDDGQEQVNLVRPALQHPPPPRAKAAAITLSIAKSAGGKVLRFSSRVVLCSGASGRS